MGAEIRWEGKAWEEEEREEMSNPNWIRPGAFEAINWGTVERVWAESVAGTLYLRVRHVSGAVDDYIMTLATARRIVKWLAGWHWVTDLREE